jgi:hypothetical protein
MTTHSITQPYPVFLDRNGDPLTGGYIYIGTANLDPVTNPINVYWDSALTIAASQPIRTLNGFPVRSGAPASLYCGSLYSIRVNDSTNQMVFYSASGFENPIADDAIATGMIQDGAITSDKLDADSVITAKILDRAVTFGKVEEVATAKVLGRVSAGSGTIEELSLNQVLDLVGSAAQGDVLYRGAAGWERLAAGTDGHVLTTKGAAANPIWDTYVPATVSPTVVAGDSLIGVATGTALHNTIPGTVESTFYSVFNGTFRIGLTITDMVVTVYRNNVAVSGPHAATTSVDVAGWVIGDKMDIRGVTTGGASGTVATALSVTAAACGMIGTTVVVNGSAP